MKSLDNFYTVKELAKFLSEQSEQVQLRHVMIQREDAISFIEKTGSFLDKFYNGEGALIFIEESDAGD